MIRLPPLPLNVRWPLQIHRAMHRQEIRSSVQYEQDHSTNGMDCSCFGMAVLYPAYHRPTGNGSRNIAARTSTVGSWTPCRYTNVSEPYARGGLWQPFVQCFFWGRPPILIP
jgi:hypothetical protein